MTENPEPTRRVRLIVLAALAVATVAGLVVGATQLAGIGGPASDSAPIPTDAASPQEDDVKAPNSDFSKLLPESKSGQEAIDALGDNLAVAAKRNNMTVEELQALLLRDATAHISTSGYIVYLDDNGR